jgi:hypothetical protein
MRMTSKVLESPRRQGIHRRKRHVEVRPGGQRRPRAPVPASSDRMHGEPMRVHRNGKGGKHVAVERGLRPTASGWPFRRDLRELASMCSGGRRGPAPPTNRPVKESLPSRA